MQAHYYRVSPHPLKELIMRKSKWLFMLCFMSIFSLNANAEENTDTITMCLDSDNIPFSSRSDNKQNIDELVAQEIAKKMQLKLSMNWVDVPLRGGLTRAIKQSFKSGACDAFMGVPIEADMLSELKENAIATTEPYLVVGYVAVSKISRSESISAMRVNSLRFGASSATPADLLLLHNKLNRKPYASNKTLLKALDEDAIDVALIWSPALVNEADGLNINNELISNLDKPDPMSWKISIAIKSQTNVLKEKINAAIQTLTQEGVLVGIAENNGLVQF